MSLRNTIIAVVLLVIIGGYALYQNHQPPLDKTPKVLSIKAADIKSIELRSPDRTIVLSRDGTGNWKIIKPIVVDAEQTTANEIADEIAGLQMTGTAEDKPTDLAPFGLAVPAVTVTVTTKDNRTLPAIMVGKQTPVGSSDFIKTADKPAVLLVNSAFAAEVNKHVDDLRTRSIFKLKPEEARKIIITSSNGQTQELDRAGSQWNFVKPKSYPADNDAVTSFLTVLGNARITQFVDDDPTNLSKYGLANPSLTVQLFGANNTPAGELQFGYRQPEASSNATYARSGTRDDDPVYTVTNDVFSSANKSFDDLRDRLVLRFDPATVGRITFVGGPVDETIDRAADGKWTVSAGGKTAPAETPVAQSLLDQLHELKANRIVADSMPDPSQYGMTKPTVTVTLYAKDGKVIDTIRTSMLQMTNKPESSDEKAQTKTIAFAATPREGTVYEIPAQAVIDLEHTGSRLHTDVMPSPTPSPAPKASAAAAPRASPRLAATP